jgi:uncharacterized damage-inducible protein DinB
VELELIKTFIEYHLDMTRRVWDSINYITEEQFLADDAYSRGSVRNLMVHLTSTDRRWLAGLRNAEDVGHLRFEDFATRAEAHQIFEQVTQDLSEYVNSLTEEEINQNPNDVPNPRWQVLLHLINHGTDHRSTVLQRLHEFGAPTFDQDFITWIWRK